MLDRTPRRCRDVHLAGAQPLDQLLRGDIDDLDLIGPVDDAVRQRLLHADTSDLSDNIVEALDVLDVQGRVHVDARFEQFDDIQIALRMAAAGSIRMREFVDEHEFRPPCEDRVEIKLGQPAPLVLDAATGGHFEPEQERLGLPAFVRLDDADHDIDAFAMTRPRRQQHFVGLADPGRGPEKNL